MKSTYDIVFKARELLELPEVATMQEIKKNHKKLIKKWHPDRCNTNKKVSTEMTKKINEAYKIIIDYCKNLKHSFNVLQIVIISIYFNEFVIAENFDVL